MGRIARGLEGIAITETLLSKVDGEAGELWVAGYPVETLAPKACFEEVLFLLWNDRLPAAAEHARLRRELAERRLLSPVTLAVLRFPSDGRLAIM